MYSHLLPNINLPWYFELTYSCLYNPMQMQMHMHYQNIEGLAHLYSLYLVENIKAISICILQIAPVTILVPSFPQPSSSFKNSIQLHRLFHCFHLSVDLCILFTHQVAILIWGFSSFALLRTTLVPKHPQNFSIFFLPTLECPERYIIC